MPTPVPRELERAGALCLAFANLAAPTRDDRRRDPRVVPSTPNYAGLVTWAQRMGAVTPESGEQLRRAAESRPQDAAAALAQAGELRTALLRLFTALALRLEPAASDLATLNRALEVRQVVAEADGFGWSWQGEAVNLDRVLWPMAQSAADLLTSGKYRRVRQCRTKGCFRLFVYANSRRLWCDANTCGNRGKGRRNRQMWRRAHQHNEARRREDSLRRIEEFRRKKAEKGEVADFDKDDPEFGVWSRDWDKD